MGKKRKPLRSRYECQSNFCTDPDHQSKKKLNSDLKKDWAFLFWRTLKGLGQTTYQSRKNWREELNNTQFQSLLEYHINDGKKDSKLFYVKIVGPSMYTLSMQKKLLYVTLTALYTKLWHEQETCLYKDTHRDTVT